MENTKERYIRIEPTIEQWEKLYEVANKLKELKPWEYLWDMDLISLLLEGDSLTVCSIMGRAGDCYAIGAYSGVKAIGELFIMAEENNIPANQLIRYQNCLMCYFGDRDDLTNKELKVIKDLGLKFRGKNNWIYFRSFEQGYAPYIVDQQQVISLTNILQHLYMALGALYKGVTVDFANGMTLMRHFNKEQQLWLNYEAPLYIPKIEYPQVSVSNEILMRHLEKENKTKIKLEIDIVYLNRVINDKKYGRPIMPKICVLAEGNSGLILDQSIITPEEYDHEVILGTAINYIKQRGIPKEIFIRDKSMEGLLASFCTRLGIKLTIRKSLRIIDNFIKYM